MFSDHDDDTNIFDYCCVISTGHDLMLIILYKKHHRLDSLQTRIVYRNVHSICQIYISYRS